jgi:lipopolysaccharide transport system ATP-binding protein
MDTKKINIFFKGQESDSKMSKDIILKAENISKQYRLGQVGTGTLSHDLNRWWHQVRGKENPYLKIGDTNDRSTKGTSEYVWALQDINFEVERGEVLGIIGKNGAGKSTLLKILSRVTAPTIGSIKFGGRVASLLEVGTGFNGEMTGRENIYLNGAILGMTKKEIASKLDEIIDFSGCERYIDTPVKRYSSGMYVRLAFAVAAFLEPEILIIDEVLAVGDADFQKKAIGKMQDISKTGGRTVLFVSHNMSAIKQLCTRCIILNNGKVVNIGETSTMINEYLKINESSLGEVFDDSEVEEGKKLKIKRVCLLNQKEEIVSEVDNSEKSFLEIEFDIFIEGFGYDVSFCLQHLEYGPIFGTSIKDCNLETYSSEKSEKGTHTYRVELPMIFLREGTYFVTVGAAIPKLEVLDLFKKELQFIIIDSISPVAKTTEGRSGVVLPVLKWEKQKSII